MCGGAGREGSRPEEGAGISGAVDLAQIHTSRLHTAPAMGAGQEGWRGRERGECSLCNLRYAILRQLSVAIAGSALHLIDLA
jgi:hypothetical protein